MAAKLIIQITQNKVSASHRNWKLFFPHFLRKKVKMKVIWEKIALISVEGMFARDDKNLMCQISKPKILFATQIKETQKCLMSNNLSSKSFPFHFLLLFHATITNLSCYHTQKTQFRMCQEFRINFWTFLGKGREKLNKKNL